MTAHENDVIVCECAARDGLQHEPEFVSTPEKIAMIEKFETIGFRRIEATSFSHPRHVPQFADAEQVLREVRRVPGVSLKATCVNNVAVERAIKAHEQGWGPDEISIVVSASEVHSVRTTRRTHAEIAAEIRHSAPSAVSAGLGVGGTIGTAFGCPFTGPVPIDDVSKWIEVFLETGVDFISLGDTTGMAQPWEVKTRLDSLNKRFPDVTWAVHFHDSRGLAIANCVAALDMGIRYLDSAFGGLGGFPAGHVYARGHTGNTCTEDLVALLHDAGFTTGIDPGKLLETSAFVENLVGRTLESRVARAGLVTDLLPAEATGTDEATTRT